MDWFPCHIFQHLCRLDQELPLLEVFFYANYLSASSREKFKADGPSTGKEVECRWFLFEVDIDIREDVEQALLGKVGGWPCLERTWHIDVLTFVDTANYSHD